MPIYEYKCLNPQCGRLYEQLEGINAPKTQSCIDCKGLAQRVASATARPHVSGGSKGSASYDCPLCNQISGKGIVLLVSISHQSRPNPNNN